VDILNPSLFDADADSPAALAALAASLVPPAAPGHFDELRGHASAPAPVISPAPAQPHLRDASAAQSAEEKDANAVPRAARARGDADMSTAWRHFFQELGPNGFADLPERARSLARQIRDNGVTYNVYADADGPQRPWALDLFPLIVSPESWAAIESGVLQRMRVLDRVLADVYGPQELLAKGLIPSALVQGHPGYLRGMHGVKPPGGTWLHIAAFDLGRGADGNWWVLAQRTQAPSGLGYLLENRIAISRQFPQAFEALHVQRLAASYLALMDGLQRMCPGEANPHIALLTPGPYNETYFEQAYLARYLGITLVEGSDLTVRNERLYLKTLEGLRQVHGLIKRLDDQYLDPLELRPDSTLGVPGLMQAVRAGNVLVANTPGTGFLESPALQGFLPGLTQHLLGETLQLPSLPSWWCGERAAMEEALPQLASAVVKSTYPDANGQLHAALGSKMDLRAMQEWAGRIALSGESHTVQSYLRLSQMPSWSDGDSQVDGSGKLATRSVMLRVFAISDGPGSWRMLPGGMARIAGPDTLIVSMQRGGSSADTWVQTHGAIDRTSLLASHASVHALTRTRAPVTSRAAENLFWFGRYTERAENAVRLARLALSLLPGEGQASHAMLVWLHRLARYNGLVPRDVPAVPRSRRVFERALIAELGNLGGASVGASLRQIRNCASAIRERLSQDHWNQIVRTDEVFERGTAALVREMAEGPHSTFSALALLEDATQALSALTGAQTDRMTRDDGWRLLSIGRHIERLAFLSDALSAGFAEQSVHDLPGFEAMLVLFDSTLTFHARYQQRRDVAPLLDLLVLDRDNPRSLAWVTQTLRGRIARLAGSAPGELAELSHRLPNPSHWSLGQFCADDEAPDHPTLLAMLDRLEASAYQVSDEIGARYFTLTAESLHAVGV